MGLRMNRVFWESCSPRERWTAFYTLYRTAYKSNYPFGTAYQCFVIMLPEHPEIQRMMHCVSASELSWVDTPPGLIRKHLFDRSRKRNRDKFARRLLREIFGRGA